MLTRITSGMPRYLYYTIKRFLLLSVSILIGTLVGFLLFKFGMWSAAVFSSPLPMLGVMIFGILVVASYHMAKIDMDVEKREKERVLQQLEKE
jgi:hypothetical protein